jgi:hypothetical protein
VRGGYDNLFGHRDLSRTAGVSLGMSFQGPLRKLRIILAASFVAGGVLWFALRPPGVSQEITEITAAAQAEVEDSVKCGHDYRAGTSAYVQCIEQLAAARTQGPPRAQLDTKGTTSTLARVGAAIVMIIMFIIMMLVFYGFWALGNWIGLDERRR